MPPVEFLKVDVGGGVTLDGYMLKPKTFDRLRKYPVLVYVYGEPAGTLVNDQWGGPDMLFHRALAEQGYLVVSFDNRGTPALKGAAMAPGRVRDRGRAVGEGAGRGDPRAG